MTNVFIIHGAYGSPDENWFPWLGSELEDSGCRVFIPRFPTPAGQSLKSWLRVFDDYSQYLDKDSIVVGHSLGPAFLLNIIEKLDHPVRAGFFVSGFVGMLDNPDFDDINISFFDNGFDWQKIRQNCQDFFVFHSDDDPYVPLEKGESLAKKLGVDVTLVRGAGHFNKDSGYTRFELLLEKIRQLL